MRQFCREVILAKVVIEAILRLSIHCPKSVDCLRIQLLKPLHNGWWYEHGRALKSSVETGAVEDEEVVVPEVLVNRLFLKSAFDVIVHPQVVVHVHWQLRLPVIHVPPDASIKVFVNGSKGLEDWERECRVRNLSQDVDHIFFVLDGDAFGRCIVQNIPFGLVRHSWNLGIHLNRSLVFVVFRW